jgi:SAM-dependent methyltransferase
VSDGEAAPTAACLACGGGDLQPWGWARDIEYFTTPETFSYARCGTCGALSISPVPLDRLATIYPPRYYSFQPQGGGPVAKVKQWLDGRLFRRILGRLPDRDLAVLDIGGGRGWILDQLRELSPRIVHTEIVDLDHAAGVAARARGHHYFEGTLEAYRPERSFDLVLMLNLIEHVADPRADLAAVASCLAPGGLVLIKTPNYDSLDGRWFRNGTWGGYHCPRHWTLFHRDSLDRLVRAAGLRTVAFSYTQGAPFWTWTTLHRLQRLGLIRASAERPLPYHPLAPLLQAGFAALEFVRGPFARTSQMFALLQREPA